MRYLKIIVLFLSLIFGGSCGSDGDHKEHSSQEGHETKKIYTCPMHPEIIRDKPGQCPICGMDLVEKKDNGENIENKDLPFLLKPTNQYVLSKITTIHLKELEMPIEFPATGIITYDTRLVDNVSARVAGRIEKLYIKYKYQPIHKGDKLMDIYSKELLTEQENYLYLLKDDPDNQTIITASENKLMFLGLTKEQVEDLKRTKKSFPTITIYSPYSGHLHDVSKNTQQNSEMDKSESMSEEMLIKEGMYIQKGQTIFNIYNTNKVWAMLNVYPEGQSLLKTGQKLKLHIDGANKDEIKASVDFIEPVLHENQKTASVRVYLDNQNGDIKIGAIVRATIMSESRKSKYLPATAVLNLGINNIVFVKDKDLFKATPVQLGIRTDGWVEIISGIDNSAIIAENAQLLMDSESFVKTDKQ
jgi:membrane fusion protein, copper/silver efflux system